MLTCTRVEDSSMMTSYSALDPDDDLWSMVVSSVSVWEGWMSRAPSSGEGDAAAFPYATGVVSSSDLEGASSLCCLVATLGTSQMTSRMFSCTISSFTF